MNIFKVIACLVYLSVSLYLAYQAVSDAMNEPWDSWETVFRVAFASVASVYMFLFFYGALQTSERDISIELRLLQRHGFSKMKNMKPEEYERLAEIEKSIDVEIAEKKRPPS